MNSNTPVKGYKVTNPDSTCRNFLFEAGKDYKHESEIKLCGSGFHFCIQPAHCFNYYKFDSTNLVYEIEAIGHVEHGDDKSVTNHIKVIRRLDWSEVLSIVNTGKDNTGLGNTGNWNTGNWNTGDSNTGYSNTGNRNTGAFCTGEKTMKFFNKDSSWTEQQFLDSKAYRLLCDVDTKMWIPDHAMSDKEKNANPSYKTAEGYLKDIPFKQAFQDKWNNWSEENRAEFISLPNFDAAIFFEITGVQVK